MRNIGSLHQDTFSITFFDLITQKNVNNDNQKLLKERHLILWRTKRIRLKKLFISRSYMTWIFIKNCNDFDFFLKFESNFLWSQATISRYVSRVLEYHKKSFQHLTTWWGDCITGPFKVNQKWQFLGLWNFRFQVSGSEYQFWTWIWKPQIWNPQKTECFQFSVNLFLSNCWFYYLVLCKPQQRNLEFWTYFSVISFFMLSNKKRVF